ncbi:bacterio-opsin activator domain-containing protein [Halopiger aswanensis]|uniref:PAS domain S-box-containing protein n=1 Tax=Halopiger aswanensis TaxID=148449 RepID=A0A419W019_9EURY|nr:bacterio-opsin activator domain-containing protein [Halopiger aswanensis]RKD88620.1 PAS domain S-box-containing protein [Halopiger aswanensis]
MAGQSLTDSLRETLALFDGSGTPRTTAELADDLEIGRRSTYERLERLVEHGELETKRVGASARVWWRPRSSAETPDSASDAGVRPIQDRSGSIVGELEQCAICLLDSNGRVRTWNAGAERITDSAAGAALGEHISTFYTAADRQADGPEATLETVAETGAVETDQWRVRGDGSTDWAAVTVEAIRDGSGNLEGFAAVLRDATEQRETERRETAERLRRQREQLEALNTLNDVVREIIDTITQRSTREEIERVVCEHLAATESYLFAWIGDVDVTSQTVVGRTEAGVDGYLDGISISVDPDDERSKGPTGRAILKREIQTTQDIRVDDRHDPWRSHIEEYGFRSSAAIPIVHEDTVYGVLNVYAERPRAFEGRERDVISQLGEVVGHAIAAAERKRALMSDTVVELQFRIRDVFGTLNVDTPTIGTITLNHVVPIEDDEYLVYGSVTANGIDGLESLVEALPHWVSVTYRTGGDERGFELRLSEPPVLSTVASLGGSVETAVIEDGDYLMTLHAAPGADVRQVVDTVQEAYPDVELLKQRQLRIDTSERVRDVLEADLTDRQRATLEAAYHAGYYEWPRDASGEDVAESLEIAPPTFNQHLRKAQRKVFDSLLSSPGRPVE